MKRLTILLVFASQIFISNSQTVQNVTSQQEGNKIKINYQLSNLSANQTTKINLYYAVNNGNFNGPLQKTSGDVGDFVTGNGNKTIMWDVLSEIGSLEGNTTFKVEVVPQLKNVFPKVTNNSFSAEVTSCKFKNNELLIDVNLTNLGEDSWLNLDISNDGWGGNRDIKLNDENGNQFLCSKYYVSQVEVKSDRNIDFVANIPIKITAVFVDVNQDIKNLTLLDIKLREKENSNNYISRLQLKNFPILK